MAGHSHWARIKRAKAANDKKRGKAWSKLSRAIIIAARNGGGDPDANLTLRYAIDAAKAENMPKDTIERAIKKGTGELASEQFEELVYEGYGPAGAAVIAQALTDNRTRTAPEIKKIFEVRGGNLGAANCVSWMFTKRGVFAIPSANVTEEQLTEIALEAGADDVAADGDEFELTCDPSVFQDVRAALEARSIPLTSAEVSMTPSTTVTLAGEDAERMLKLIEALEEHDDIQNVYSNFEITEEEMARLLT